ncbi:MAG: hypothetical protein ACKVHF_05895, partial [Candidatus Poseidoniales archaeon]
MGAQEDRAVELRLRKTRSKAGGGNARIASQHAKGKMTARERIDV